MNYEQAVTEAAGLLTTAESANWRLAELTHDCTVDGAGRPANSAGTRRIRGVSMAQWCADVRDASPGKKFSEWTGKTYKRMWVANKHLAPDLPGWTEAYYEAIGETSADREERAAEHYLQTAPVEKLGPLMNQARIRQAAHDRENIEEVEQRVKVERQQDAVSQVLDEKVALLDLSRAMSVAARDMRAALARCGRLPEANTDALATGHFLREEYARVRSAVEEIGAFLSTGAPSGDVDAFVGSVLHGDQR